jgi:hypothetical protein
MIPTGGGAKPPLTALLRQQTLGFYPLRVSWAAG